MLKKSRGAGTAREDESKVTVKFIAGTTILAEDVELSSGTIFLYAQVGSVAVTAKTIRLSNICALTLEPP